MPDGLDVEGGTSSAAADGMAGRRVVAVLGMHRSGTSALTRTLNLLGLGLARELVPADDTNRSGHWESAALVVLHDEVLAALGSFWFDWRRLPFDAVEPGRWAQWARRLRELLATEHGPGGIVVKDPRMARLQPLLREALADADLRALLIVRRPEAVAASLRARRSWFPGRDEAEARLAWLRHNLDAERASRGLPRAVLLYDELLRDWRGALGRALERAGLADLAPSPEAAAAIDAFLNPALRHHEAGSDALLAEWCEPAWAALAALARNPGDGAAMAALDGIEAKVADAEAVVARLLETAIPRAQAAERAWVAARSGAEHLQALVHERNARIAALEEEAARHRATLADFGARVRRAEAEAARLGAALAERDHEVRRAEAEAAGLGASLVERDHELRRVVEAFRASWSWRVTAPLRGIGSMGRIARDAAAAIRMARRP